MSPRTVPAPGEVHVQNSHAYLTKAERERCLSFYLTKEEKYLSFSSVYDARVAHGSLPRGRSVPSSSSHASPLNLSRQRAPMAESPSWPSPSDSDSESDEDAWCGPECLGRVKISVTFGHAVTSSSTLRPLRCLHSSPLRSSRREAMYLQSRMKRVPERVSS